MSRLLFLKTMPVTPPTVNKNKNPKIHRSVGVMNRGVPKREVTHLNTLIPVGTAITIVAAVKYARVSRSIPTVNIWWAHTTQPSSPILNIAYTMPRVPKISFLPVTNIIACLTIPKAGRIRTYTSG